MTKLTAEQCADLLERALANCPADKYSDEALHWYADVAGTITAHDVFAGMSFKAKLSRIADTGSGLHSPVAASMRDKTCKEFELEARSLLKQLQLEANKFKTVLVPAGSVHDYFEEIRGFISGAQEEVFFVDRFITPDFVSLYLPQIGVTPARLLSSNGNADALLAAVRLFNQQHGQSVQVRVLPKAEIHDRYLVIDRRDVYQSGASFKDGAKTSGALINQIVDSAPAIIGTLETMWGAAKLVI